MHSSVSNLVKLIVALTASMRINKKIYLCHAKNTNKINGLKSCGATERAVGAGEG